MPYRSFYCPRCDEVRQRYHNAKKCGHCRADLVAVPDKIPQTGASLIAAERMRQITEEGWDADHDKEHEPMVLALAGACYAAGEPLFVLRMSCIEGTPRLPNYTFETAWPFRSASWKPKDALRDLVRAGALIAAEIDRRLNERQ